MAGYRVRPNTKTVVQFEEYPGAQIEIRPRFTLEDFTTLREAIQVVSADSAAPNEREAVDQIVRFAVTGWNFVDEDADGNEVAIPVSGDALFQLVDVGLARRVVAELATRLAGLVSTLTPAEDDRSGGAAILDGIATPVPAANRAARRAAAV